MLLIQQDAIDTHQKTVSTKGLTFLQHFGKNINSLASMLLTQQDTVVKQQE